MKNNHTTDSVLKELDKVEVGMLDSVSNRSRLYLLAFLAETQNEADYWKEKFDYEVKVNNRVNEIFKGWFHREG